MKKFFLILALCALFIFIGCGGSESEESEKNEDCITIDSYTWSPKSSGQISWDDAVNFCNDLIVCGYSDWHLPTISELRTLIKNCSGTETGGSCGVTNSCLSSNCWIKSDCTCDYYEDGIYSKFGENDLLWSSSDLSDAIDAAWGVYFRHGYIREFRKTDGLHARCIR